MVSGPLYGVQNLQLTVDRMNMEKYGRTNRHPVQQQD